MNLVIDRGNTHLKYAIFDKRQLIASDSVDFLDKRDIEDLTTKYPIKQSILSSVVTRKNEELCNNLKAHSTFFIELEHTTKLPFIWNYKTKASIGKDRLAAVAGAIDLFPNKDILIFDAGTALTYELISSNAEFLGGNISPGIQMRFKALNHFTSRLPLLETNINNPLLGNSTNEAIIGGVQNSIKFEVDGIINHFRTQYRSLEIVITGGDAEFFARMLKNPIFVAPKLVLFGLNRILEHNA